jgi:hypothetical protein
MAFTSGELDNILNGTMDYHLNKGKVFAQNISQKPLVAAFDANAKTFPGGKGNVTVRVKSGQGGGTLGGYTHDDTVSYYNPIGTRTATYPWREHHIGIGVTHTELKMDGITVIENGADQTTREKDGREEQALANLLDEKMELMAEDYAVSWDTLVHGDGTGDAKAIAGIRAFILDSPITGTTGSLSRSTYSYWRNRARTAAYATATTSANGPITSATTSGGALLQFLQGEGRQINRYSNGGTKRRNFCGSDFIGAYETEIRANGRYTDNGYTGTQTGDMGGLTWMGKPLEYDPTLDNLGLSKRMYSIDFRGIFLMYMQGEKMKKANPARPYDKYVMYKALTTTGVMVAQQLNTSGVYDIA